ncbi:MAG: transposase, partial [Jiangellales bacterium]
MKRSPSRSRVHVRAEASGVVSLAGVQLLVETARATGLDTALSKGLAPWRRPLATHDPGRIVAHLAMALAAGGDCPADIAV